MFEYESFEQFSPFGTICVISGLDGFLRFFDYFWANKMELFFPKISLDLIDGLQFLHNNGIVHRDLRPANIQVSNKHYTNITEAAELNNPIPCKLTDSGKSRSLIQQTRNILETQIKHMQRGTLLFMVPEQLPE